MGLLGVAARPAQATPVLAVDTLPSGLGVAMGRNDFGQVLPGSTTNQLNPVSLPKAGGGALTDAVSLAAGNGFVVWADHVGRVWSLGNNGSGTAGNGSTGGVATVPTAAAGFGGSGQAKAVKVSSYGLAVDVLDSDGNVWQWGQVVNNQSTLSVQSTPSKLTFPTGAARIVDVAAGSSFSLALSATGLVYSWGKNDHGQLGTGTNNTSPYPVQVPQGNGKPLPALAGGSQVVLDAGREFAVYVIATGTAVDVYTWGRGDSYQLGNGLALDQKSPVKATSIPSTARVRSLSAGGTHSLLLNTDGTLRTWGNNGLTTAMTPATVADPAAAIHSAQAVAAGDGDSFVSSLDGTVAAWGTDTTGQLGRGATGTVTAPTLVAIPGATPATLSGRAPVITSRQGETYVLVDAQITRGSALSGRSFGAFPTNPAPSQSAPAYVVTFPNVANKALTSVSLATSGNTADFALSGSTCTGTLAVDATCSVTVTFRPAATGARSAVLTLSTTNTYGGALLVTQIPLSGTAYTAVNGVQNYGLAMVGGGTSAVTTSGRGNVIDLKTLSPDLIPATTTGTQAAGLPVVGKIPILQAGLPVVGKIGLPVVGKIGLPVVGKIGLPVVGKIAVVGKIPLSVVGKIPLPVVGKIPLSVVGKIPLNTLGGWQTLLQDYPNLAQLPISSVTLANLLDPAMNQPASSAIAPIFDRLSLGDVDIVHSIFKDVSAFAFLMGGTRLDQYSGVDWCSSSAQYPAGLLSGVTGGQATCSDSDGLHRTLFELSFAYKVNIGDLPFSNVTIGSIVTDSLSKSSDPLEEAGFASVVLNSPTRISGTHLNVALTAIPNLGAVVDCTKTDCTNLAGRHLGDSDVLAAIWPNSSTNPPVPTFRTLGSALSSVPVGDVLEPFIDVSVYPWELLPKASIPFQAYPGRVTYQADADINCFQASGVTMGFALPAGFDYVPGTATLARTRGTGNVLLADPTPVTGRGLVVSIPDSSFSSTGALACPSDSAHVSVRISALPSDTAATALKATGDLRTSAGLSAAGTESTGGLSVTGVYAPPDASPDGPLGAPDTLIFGSISTPGQVQYVPFTATPGQVVEATLSTEYGPTSGKHDLDLVLYDPVGASAERSLTGTATSSPFGEVPSDSLFNANGGSLQDLPRLSDRLIAAASAGRGNDGEQLSAIARAGSDTRHVTQISGYDGGTGAYTLRLRITDPPSLGPCTTSAPPMTGAAPTSAFYNASGFSGTENTLVLVNTQRLAGAFGSAGQSEVLGAADLFTKNASASGKVIQLDFDPGVRAAYAAWDAAPCDPVASNGIVPAIAAFVRGLPNLPASIRYVTLVGNHNMIPYTWLEDRTRDGNEREEATDLAFTGSNPLAAAMAAGYYASDDPYGTKTPVAVLDQLVYLPQWSVGRLGESQSDIVGQLNRFVTNNGLADPHTASTRNAVVTDYDFLSRSGAATTDALTAAGYNTVHDLTGTNTAWTRAQLDSEWLGKADPPDVAVLNMHYDQYRALPAKGFRQGDLTELYTASSVQSGPSLDKRVVFTVGCHSALGVPDAYNPNPGAGLNPAVDFAQAYAGSGAAVMVGNLGFGFADANTIAYSARVQQLFAQGFSTSSSLGAALASAKRTYVGQFAALSPYDLKAAQEMVLWGLPQYRVPASGTSTPAVSGATTGVDPFTGLTAASLRVATSVDPQQGTGGTTYFAASGPGGSRQTVSISGRPILGSQNLLLPDLPGKVLRSVSPRALTSQERGTYTNTFAQAGTDLSPTTAALSKGDLPSTLGHGWSIPTATGTENTLVYTPEQVHLDGSAPGVGSVRTFSDASWVALYVDAGTPEGVPDTITNTSAATVPAGNGAPAATSYSAKVITPPNAITTSVYVLAMPAQTGPGPVAWHLIQLAKDQQDPTLFTGGEQGSISEYRVFATNSLGVTAESNNKTFGWPSNVLSAISGTARSHVQFNSSPNASGWYNTAPLIMTIDSGYTAKVNGVPVSGSSYTFPRDGVYTMELFDSSGTSLGAFPASLDSVVPAVQVVFDPTKFSTVGAENQTGLHRVIPVTINVTAGASGLNGPPQVSGLTGDSTNGYFFDTSAVNLHSVQVSATSVAGLTGTFSYAYRVVYGAASSGFLAPVVSAPGLNLTTRTLVYGFSYRLVDDNGANVTTGAGSGNANAFTTIPCPNATNTAQLPKLTAASAQPVYTGNGGVWLWDLNMPNPGNVVVCNHLKITTNDGVSHFDADVQLSP